MEKITKVKFRDILTSKPSHFVGVVNMLRKLPDEFFVDVYNQYELARKTGNMMEIRRGKANNNGIVFSDGSSLFITGANVEVYSLLNDNMLVCKQNNYDEFNKCMRYKYMIYIIL